MSATTQAHITSGRDPRPRGDRVSSPAIEDDRLLLSVVEAARRLGIGRTLMYELLRSGQVPSVRVGRLRKVATAALETFVVDLREQGASGRPAR